MRPKTAADSFFDFAGKVGLLYLIYLGIKGIVMVLLFPFVMVGILILAIWSKSNREINEIDKKLDPILRRMNQIDKLRHTSLSTEEHMSLHSEWLDLRGQRDRLYTERRELEVRQEKERQAKREAIWKKFY